jgi:hypothetical protein
MFLPDGFSDESLLSQSRVARQEAVRVLLQTIGTGTDQAVSNAAGLARELGADDPRIPWSAVYAIEARHADIAALRNAVEPGNDAACGAAWAKCMALWPRALPPELDAAGRAAFRRWGRSLRRRSQDSGRASA